MDLKINQIRIMKDFDPIVYISVCRVIKMFWILLFWRAIFKKHGFVLEKAKFSLFKEFTKNEEHSYNLAWICFFTKYIPNSKSNLLVRIFMVRHFCQLNLVENLNCTFFICSKEILGYFCFAYTLGLLSCLCIHKGKTLLQEFLYYI